MQIRCLCLSVFIIAQAMAAPLIPLNSTKGATLLKTATVSQPYFQLSPYFVTQKNQAFCGVASSVMVLNALPLKRPFTYQYAPQYQLFTQENVFNANVSAAGLDMIHVQVKGMTLDQVATLLKLNGAKPRVYSAKDLDEQQFHRLLQTTLAQHQSFVIINFLRTKLKQKGGGHISPVAAYNQSQNSYLILDVARYKAPPVWVPAHQLWAAINTQYSLHNTTEYRGMIIVH